MNSSLLLILFVIFLLLVAVIIVYAITENKKTVNSDDSLQNAKQTNNTDNPYVSIEHEENCDKVYFHPLEIVKSIMRELITGIISQYDYNTSEQIKPYIKQGEIIAIIVFKWREVFSTPSTKTQYFERSKQCTVLSPIEGYIEYHQVPMTANGARFCIASIYKDYNTLLEHEYAYKSVIKTDAFDNTKSIKWECVNGKDYTQYLPLDRDSISISFNLNVDEPVLLVKYKYKVVRGTTLEILFDNDNKAILQFPLTGKISSDGSFIIPLTSKDIDCFIANNVLIIRTRKGDIITDNSIDDTEQVSIMRFASAFKEAITPFIELNEPQKSPQHNNNDCAIETIDEENDDSCWVYLMQDLANNAYKIGISNNPEYREKTLQSEKPTIVKIAAKQFPTRDIARAIEASLHKVYEIRRIRGEWFRLEPNEVEDVKKSLK